MTVREFLENEELMIKAFEPFWKTNRRFLGLSGNSIEEDFIDWFGDIHDCDYQISICQKRFVRDYSIDVELFSIDAKYFINNELFSKFLDSEMTNNPKIYFYDKHAGCYDIGCLFWPGISVCI